MSIGPLFRPLLAVAREDGLDIEGLLRRAGTSEAELIEPATRLSPARSRSLLQAFLAASRDPTVGLRAAEKFVHSDADLLGFIVREAPSALAILEGIARFARLLGDSATCDVERAGDTVVFVLGNANFQMLPEATDFYLAAIALFVGKRSGGSAVPRAATLSRSRPRSSDLYARVFGCPVTFSSERATLSYAEAPLLAPLAGRDPRLGEILESGAVEALARLPGQESVVERALAVLSTELEGGPVSLESLATRFGMSERTLRRRLADDGVTYRDLVDRARHLRAVTLLGEGERTITEVALLVGFEDATSFTRAFRRWTGEPPGTFTRARRR